MGVIEKELTQGEEVNELSSWELIRSMGVIERKLTQSEGVNEHAHGS